jgi:hypothetical protein
MFVEVVLDLQRVAELRDTGAGIAHLLRETPPPRDDIDMEAAP